jgi:hypothetical protein
VECVAIWVREVRRVDVRLRTVGRWIIAVELVWQGQRRAVRGEGECDFDAVNWDIGLRHESAARLGRERDGRAHQAYGIVLGIACSCIGTERALITITGRD